METQPESQNVNAQAAGFGEETLSEVIRQTPLGFQAGDEVVDALARLARLENFAAGTELFREGDQHGWLYIVCRGNVALNMTTATCGQQQILTAGIGDVVAWSALLVDESMTATAIATEETRMLVFNASELRAACDSDHHLGYTVMRWMARSIAGRLLATRLQLLDLFHL